MSPWRISLIFCCCLAAPAQQQMVAKDPDTARIVGKILSMVGPADPKVLTERERFEQYVLNTVGPVPLFGAAVGAGFNQWTNTPGEWGYGGAAYGKRYASNFGYNAV